MPYIPTLKDLLEGGDIDGRRLDANTKGRRPVVPSHDTRARGPDAEVLDGPRPAEPPGESPGDLYVLSIRDLECIVTLLRDKLRSEPERFAYGVAEIAAATGLCEASVRNQIRRGRLAARRVGGRLLIEPEAVREWMRSYPLTTEDGGE